MIAAVLLAATVEVRNPIRIGDYIGKPPSRLHGRLGKVIGRWDQCGDADGGTQTEFEDGYICTVDNRVVVLSYKFYHDVDTPERALGIVGLKMSTAPRRALAGYIWSVVFQNAIIINADRRLAC